jgi:hypothetical protein
VIGRRRSESTKLEPFDGYTPYGAIIPPHATPLIGLAIVELSYVDPVPVLLLSTAGAHDLHSFSIGSDSSTLSRK